MGDTREAPLTSKTSTGPEGLTVTVLAVLLSLIVKSALDRTFETVPRYHANTLPEIWGILAVAPERRLLILFQLGVFFFTLLRFYLGAYRFAKFSDRSGLPETVVTLIGTFLLFSGFYVTSLTLRSPSLFYLSVVLFHILDFVWFFVAHTLLRVRPELAAVVGLWKVFDVVTVIAIVALFFLVPGYGGRWLSLMALLAIGACDFWILRPFYLAEEEWATRTSFVKWKLAP